MILIFYMKHYWRMVQSLWIHLNLPIQRLLLQGFFSKNFIIFFSSGIVSSRRTHMVPVEGKNDYYEEEDVIQTRFERFLQEKLDLPSSDNGIYLARTVAPILTKTLAEVSYFSIC